MNNIIPIEQNIDHKVSELMCLSCMKRFIDVRPLTTWLKDLQCPACNKAGYLIETGEDIPDELYTKVCDENSNLKIYRQLNTIYQDE